MARYISPWADASHGEESSWNFCETILALSANAGVFLPDVALKRIEIPATTLLEKRPETRLDIP